MWMCLRSGYMDKLMIPQLIELAVDYNVDGTWIDGNSWGYRGCCCDKCKAEFTRRTGITEIPAKPGDKYWKEWYFFHLNTEQDAVEYFSNAVKAVAPNFRICSAWLGSTYHPTTRDVSVDWLSGDVWGGGWSSEETNFESRWFANSGKPWDLMCWTNLAAPDYFVKTPEMFCQEATPVIACGGRYIFCECAPRVRSSKQVNSRMRQYRKVRDFIKARESFCRGSETVPEIALLHERSDSQEERGIQNWIFLPSTPATSMLIDNHYGVDLLDARRLLPRLKDFPMVVIPETGELKPEVTDALKTYVENGGRLLVAGVDSIANFGAIISALPTGRSKQNLHLRGLRGHSNHWSKMQRPIIICRTGMAFFLWKAQSGDLAQPQRMHRERKISFCLMTQKILHAKRIKLRSA